MLQTLSVESQHREYLIHGNWKAGLKALGQVQGALAEAKAAQLRYWTLCGMPRRRLRKARSLEVHNFSTARNALLDKFTKDALIDTKQPLQRGRCDLVVHDASLTSGQGRKREKAAASAAALPCRKETPLTGSLNNCDAYTPGELRAAGDHSSRRHPMQLASYNRFPSELSPGNSAA
jgi:hypothetical protein